jgi:hypothetical protein
MKKIILFSIALIAASFSYAQLGFGIKGAFTMSKLSTNLSDYTEAAKTGYQVGAFVRLGKKLHLQPEAYFTVKSGKTTFDIPTDLSNPNSAKETVNQSVTLNSIDVPLLIGYQIAKLPGLKIRLQAGPVASMVVNKKYDINYSGITEEEKTSIEDSYKNANWALQFGAGVDFLFLTADIRYELGLSDINDPADVSIKDYLPNEKNNVFFISVGWKIL